MAAAPAAAQPTARERQSAAEAYDRGTAAFVAADYETAARWFETAHRLAPAAAALAQAVRAHARAGDAYRAATLALALQEAYPGEGAAQRVADQALIPARRFVRVEVSCQGCAIEVDGDLLERTTFFVAPDTQHEVVASFDTGNRTEQVQAAAGETVALRFEAPEAPEARAGAARPGGAGEAAADPGSAPVTDDGDAGVPFLVTLAGLVVTAGLGATLIWSGVDTLDGVPAYEANPTVEALEDGRSREARTNWLVAGTAVAAAATLVLLLFTDWGTGSDDDPERDTEAPEVQATLEVQGAGAAVGLWGRF